MPVASARSPPAPLLPPCPACRQIENRRRLRFSGTLLEYLRISLFLWAEKSPSRRTKLFGRRRIGGCGIGATLRRERYPHPLFVLRAAAACARKIVSENSEENCLGTLGHRLRSRAVALFFMPASRNRRQRDSKHRQSNMTKRAVA